jgi:hypothetical protein
MSTYGCAETLAPVTADHFRWRARNLETQLRIKARKNIHSVLSRAIRASDARSVVGCAVRALNDCLDEGCPRHSI